MIHDMIDRFLMGFRVQLEQWIGIHLSDLIAVILSYKEKENTVDMERKWNTESKKRNNSHFRARTEGGLWKMLKWRCDQCFGTLRLLHSLSEPPPFVLALFSLPRCPSSGHTSAMFCYKTIFDPLTSRLFVDLFFPLLFLCSAHVHMPNTKYIAHERKKVSTLKIPRWKHTEEAFSLKIKLTGCCPDSTYVLLEKISDNDIGFQNWYNATFEVQILEPCINPAEAWTLFNQLNPHGPAGKKQRLRAS